MTGVYRIYIPSVCLYCRAYAVPLSVECIHADDPPLFGRLPPTTGIRRVFCLPWRTDVPQRGFVTVYHLPLALVSYLYRKIGGDLSA